MIKRIGRLASVAAASLLLGSAAPMLAGCDEKPAGGGSCCRVCRTGKACGDTCIARNETCRTSGGCACNG